MESAPNLDDLLIHLAIAIYQGDRDTIEAIAANLGERLPEQELTHVANNIVRIKQCIQNNHAAIAPSR